MCDSMILTAWIDDMPDAEYDQCHYPFLNSEDAGKGFLEFRDVQAVSPLTGAGFVITPIGMLLPDGKKRYPSGRIAGYEVSVNVPACLIGHNRLVVNGAYLAAISCICLLKFWLVLNGCTVKGVDHIRLANARLKSVTLLYLFLHASEELARETLARFRRHTEALLNSEETNSGTGKHPAFSHPPEPPVDGGKYTYTAYVRERKYKIAAYVKERNQPNAFLLALDDPALESEVQADCERTLRLEVRAHESWLKDKLLDDPAAWRNNDAPYELVFGLMRGKLRLDDGLRPKRLKKKTIQTLRLTPDDKRLLEWHISDNKARDHPMFKVNPDPKNRMDRYYAASQRIYTETKGIDLEIPYKVQIKQLEHDLGKDLAFPGEFVPPAHLEPFVYSRTSVPLAIDRLEEIIGKVLKHGPSAVPPLPSRKVLVADNRPLRLSMFERALAMYPIDPKTGEHIVPDDFSSDDDEEF